MIWGLFVGNPILSLHGQINNQDYLEILSNQVHPIVQVMSPERNAIFQDDNAPIHTARFVEEQSDEVEHLVWPPQSPNLNIIEHLWPVLELQIRSQFPPPLSLKEL